MGQSMPAKPPRRKVSRSTGYDDVPQTTLTVDDDGDLLPQASQPPPPPTAHVLKMEAQRLSAALDSIELFPKVTPVDVSYLD